MAKPFSKLQKKNYLEDGEGRLLSLSILRQKSLNLVVIPGLTTCPYLIRNPICLNWIPAGVYPGENWDGNDDFGANVKKRWTRYVSPLLLCEREHRG